MKINNNWLGLHGEQLIDGEEMHRSHPELFYMPTLKERMEVEFGSLVKIGVDKSLEDGSTGERFWVRVLARYGKRFCGLVANDLNVVEGCGMLDLVFFHARNIIDIDADPTTVQETLESCGEHLLKEIGVTNTD